MTSGDFNFGEYLYQKKKKRDQLRGSVVTPGTPVVCTGTYYTQGPFIVEEIFISNFETETVTISILDGPTGYKIRNASSINGVALAAGATVTIEPCFMPFFTAVMIDASSPNVIVTFGGWIP